jgi:hypothetical protein
MKSTFKSLALAGLLASAGFAAFSQPMGQGAAGMPMMGASSPMQPGGKMGMRASRDPAKMEAMMAKRHADLKAKLKLSAEQEGAWTTFTAAMKPPARMDTKYPDRAEMDKLTTPERIDKMCPCAPEHDRQRMPPWTNAKRHRAFYAALNAEQKRCLCRATPAWEAATANTAGSGATRCRKARGQVVAGFRPARVLSSRCCDQFCTSLAPPTRVPFTKMMGNVGRRSIFRALRLLHRLEVSYSM